MFDTTSEEHFIKNKLVGLVCQCLGQCTCKDKRLTTNHCLQQVQQELTKQTEKTLVQISELGRTIDFTDERLEDTMDKMELKFDDLDNKMEKSHEELCVQINNVKEGIELKVDMVNQKLDNKFDQFEQGFVKTVNRISNQSDQIAKIDDLEK